MHIISLFISLHFFNPIPSDTCNHICWNEDRQLQWEDFQGNIPDTTSFIYAISSCNIKVAMFVRSEIPEFIVNVRFSRSKSWTRGESEQFLKHEQTHFNIVELYARKLRSSIDSLQQLEIKDQTTYSKIIIQLNSQADKSHAVFDRETRYGNNLDAQQLWERRIRMQFSDLSAFKSASEECDCGN